MSSIQKSVTFNEKSDTVEHENALVVESSEESEPGKDCELALYLE